MRHQKVSVDVMRMVTSSANYLFLAAAAWLLVKLVCACFWLPGELRRRRLREQAIRQQARLLLGDEGVALLDGDVDDLLAELDKEIADSKEPPQSETQPETQSESQSETQAESQPETEAETQPETEAETQSETEAETQPEPQSETDTEEEPTEPQEDKKNL